MSAQIVRASHRPSSWRPSVRRTNPGCWYANSTWIRSSIARNVSVSTPGARRNVRISNTTATLRSGDGRVVDRADAAGVRRSLRRARRCDGVVVDRTHRAPPFGRGEQAARGRHRGAWRRSAPRRPHTDRRAERRSVADGAHPRRRSDPARTDHGDGRRRRGVRPRRGGSRRGDLPVDAVGAGRAADAGVSSTAVAGAGGQGRRRRVLGSCRHRTAAIPCRHARGGRTCGVGGRSRRRHGLGGRRPGGVPRRRDADLLGARRRRLGIAPPPASLGCAIRSG